MPAANERALEKAKGTPADAIIFDLEDAVSPDAKNVARGQAVAAANSGEYGKRELTIRCNALDTPWGKDDIAAAAKACVTAVVIPKVSSVAELDAVSAALDAAGAPKEMMIWAMIEPASQAFEYGDKKLELGLKLWILWTLAIAGLAGTVFCALGALAKPVVTSHGGERM